MLNERLQDMRLHDVALRLEERRYGLLKNRLQDIFLGYEMLENMKLYERR